MFPLKRLFQTIFPQSICKQMSLFVAPLMVASARRCIIQNRSIEISLSLSLVQLLSITGVHAQGLPSISKNGTYAVPQSVSITASSGTLYYTLDGTQPDNTSTPYVSAFTVSQTTQVNAVSYLTGSYSAVVTSFIDIDPKVSPVTVPPPGGSTPPTPILWLKGKLGVTSSGSPSLVSSWIDWSGAANSASGAGAAKPVYLEKGINCLPSISFNGSSHYLSVPSGFANFTSGYTIFVVVKPSALTAGSTLIDLGNAGSGNNLKMQISSSGSLGEFWSYSGGSGTSVQSAAALDSSKYQVLEVVQSPGSPNDTATFYVDGVAGTANTSMNNIPNVSRTSNFIGQGSSGGNFFDGAIAEIILYSTALTTSQRQSVESFLLQQYQIPSQVPSDPIISVAGGALTEPTQVTIASPSDAITHITTDGSTPDNSTPAYNGEPLTISHSQTLKAIAIKNGVSSSVSSETYTLDSDQWPAPSGGDTSAPTFSIRTNNSPL